MACKCYQKSSLEAITTRELAVNEGDYISFDINRIHTGTSISHAEGSPVVRLNSAGLYLVSFDGDFTITTAGSVSVQLLNKGVAVPGVQDTVSGTTAVPRGLHFTTLINVMPNCCAVDNSANLAVTISDAGTFSNANLTVVKMA